ncbi:MAG TPA: glycosyltransferase family 1 protein [Planctomycetaceae bacterium]|nr:glycosyltransferase family 1 protein [Planctomycetaceae bacterium]
MRIVYLASGAGNMYCGSCLQSHTLVAALREAGHDAIMVPVYLPLRADEPDVAARRVVFGALNVYVQQRWSLFRNHSLADRLLDHPLLLRMVARLSAGRRPEGLGALTVSMLRGEAGHQHRELAKLVRWLARQVRPDVVHLSNLLLVGMAGVLRRQLSVPVVASLAGEDVFLEKLQQPWRDRAWQLAGHAAHQLAALIAMSRSCADRMADRLRIDRRAIHVVPPGLNLDGHLRPEPASTRRPAPDSGRRSLPIRIGYLARICEEKGLHLLADAFIHLAADPQLPPLEVAVAGYLDPKDRPYLKRIQRRLARHGCGRQLRYAGELDRPGKIAFLQSLDLFSLPSTHPESKGLAVLEAWANGVPAVLPAHGAFPEMMADTGGGVLCRPHDPQSLADALRRLILDPQKRTDCGRRAQQAVHQRYRDDRMARDVLAVYRRAVGQYRSRTGDTRPA